MKIYFTGSIAAKNKYLPLYEKIISYLQSKKHDVIADHIMKASEESVRLASREERLAFHNQIEKWIKSCDFMIAETSFPSISVGYEISFALRMGKPVLILYSEGDPPSLLAYHVDEKVHCEKYNVNNLQNIIGDFMQFVEGKNDTRFTFFLSSDLNHYLEIEARKKRLPKSVYLRDLILRDRDQNKDA